MLLFSAELSLVREHVQEAASATSFHDPIKETVCLAVKLSIVRDEPGAPFIPYPLPLTPSPCRLSIVRDVPGVLE